MKPNVQVQSALAGYFKIEAINAKTGRVRLLAPWQKNRILDQGLNRLAVGAPFGYAQVGSGSTAPTNTDTGLQSFVAASSSTQSTDAGSQVDAPYYGWYRQRIRFGEGVAAGNLSEVGFGWGITGTELFSRSLIRDAENNPTTITVLPDEFLDVTYELRVYPPLVDTNGTVTISGVVYNTVMRAAGYGGSWSPSILAYAFITTPYLVAAVHEGPLGTMFQYPGGTAANAGIQLAAYSNNSYKRTGQLVLGLNDGNLAGGIGAVSFGGGIGAFQMSLAAQGSGNKIPKDNTKVLTLNFEHSWGRYTG